MVVEKYSDKELLDIKDRVSHLLDEVRVVLPGTQTLLGFQLAAVFQQGFAKMQYALQLVHLCSLSAVGLAIILLMAVPAYDRIVYKREVTENFINFATRIVLLALLCLAIGLSGDTYVVFSYIMKSSIIAASLSLVVFIICMFLWFGYSYYNRKQHN